MAPLVAADEPSVTATNTGTWSDYDDAVNRRNDVRVGRPFASRGVRSVTGTGYGRKTTRVAGDGRGGRPLRASRRLTAIPRHGQHCGTSASARLAECAPLMPTSQANQHEGSLATPARTPALTRCPDGSIQADDRLIGKAPAFVKGDRASLLPTSVFPNDRYTISMSPDCSLRIFDVKTQREVALVVLAGSLTSVTCARDGTTVLAGDELGNLYWLEVEGVSL